MKKRRTFIGLSLVLCLMLACLTGCGDGKTGGAKSGSAPTVVAEGTTLTEHAGSVDIALLYQEYSDGTVNVYYLTYNCPQSSNNQLASFAGSVEKGTDADGDPCVTLTMNTVTTHYYVKEGASEKAKAAFDALQDKQTEVGEAFRTQTTNDYDKTTGEYTISYAFNFSGYADKEVSITVVPTKAPTDLNTWMNQYLGK